MRIKEITSSVAYLIAVGLVSILGQVIILRELNVAFYGIELIYVLSLGFWLFGTAIGAALGRRSGPPAEARVHLLFLLTSLVLLIDIAFIRGTRVIFGAVPGGYLPFELQVAALAAALLPISLLTGVLFQFSANRFMSEGGTLANAYAIESAGGVFGGLLSTFLLMLGIQNLTDAFFCSAISAGVVLMYSSYRPAEKYLSTIGLVALIVLICLSGSIGRWMTSWNHPDLVGTFDTPYGRISVTAQEEQVCVFENDALSYETETTAAEEFVQLSTLQSASLKKILVLGGGLEGIIFELLKLPVDTIDYIEMNRNMIEAVLNHLPAGFRDAIYDGRVRIINQDPRRFTGQSYDVILVAMPEPMSAQNNRFYTQEFFEHCSRELTREGIVAFMIPSAENLWTNQLVKRNGSIYRALRAVFANTVVLPGVANVFIASDSPLTADTSILCGRFRNRHLNTRLVSPEYINYVYTNDRFKTVENLLSSVSVDPNSDLKPACYGYTLSIWLSKFVGGIDLNSDTTSLTDSAIKSPFFWLTMIVALVIVFKKRFVATRLFLLTVTAGFTGMLLETVLILNYQNKSGALYQDIGFLLTTFMGGLAIGSWAGNRLFIRWDVGARKLIGGAILLGLIALSLIVYCGISSGLVGTLLSASLALLLDGFFVSGIFALASFKAATDLERISTWLYSADLVGGCLGSIAASLVLVPSFGILTTCVISAFACIVGFIFLR